MADSLTPAEAQINMWKWQWRRRIAIARGDYEPALLLRNARVVNVFTEEIVDADIAIDAGVICGIGAFSGGREVHDLQGRFVAPSFIDAHIHTEGSLLWMPNFARAVVPHGTGAIVTDPHEIANVVGLPGIQRMREAAKDLPLAVFFTAPSCVPASEHESAGAVMSPTDIAEMLDWPETVGLGEMMNFPGVLRGDGDIGNILAAARGHRKDGHAPTVTGPDIQAYIAAGMGSDHESVSADEALDKLRLGMMIMIREGSSEKNLDDVITIVNDATYPRCCFASDDRDCHDLAEIGHVDDILRRAIDRGIPAVRAIRMATWNAAQYWQLPDRGAIAPGYRADLVVMDDLDKVRVHRVYHDGELVAENGQILAQLAPIDAPPELLHTVHVAPVRRSQMQIAGAAVTAAVQLIPGQIVTRGIRIDPTVKDGMAVADTDRDLLKAVSVERHHATGRMGVGFVQGFGLKRGALASTIAHDAHNIIAVGTTDEDILAAISLVAESQGGLAVVDDGQILGHIPLPIAGLMSDRPLEEVAPAYDELRQAARALGSELDDPFGQLAFLSLSVIPEARVTDRGLLLLTSLD